LRVTIVPFEFVIVNCTWLVCLLSLCIIYVGTGSTSFFFVMSLVKSMGLISSAVVRKSWKVSSSGDSSTLSVVNLYMEDTYC
jgi:hypothetical protein